MLAPFCACLSFNFFRNSLGPPRLSYTVYTVLQCALLNTDNNMMYSNCTDHFTAIVLNVKNNPLLLVYICFKAFNSAGVLCY